MAKHAEQNAELVSVLELCSRTAYAHVHAVGTAFSILLTGLTYYRLLETQCHINKIAGCLSACLACLSGQFF